MALENPAIRRDVFYSGISSGDFMIFIPIDSHFLHIVSISIMLSAPKYNIGVNPRSDAIVMACLTGESICLPVANQKSSSHTQKSSSVCVAIACLSVMMMSSMISNCFPIVFRYSLIGFFCFGFSVGVSSKVISENVGADICVKSGISKSLLSVGSMSKSVGSGISLISVSGISTVGVGVFCVC